MPKGGRRPNSGPKKGTKYKQGPKTIQALADKALYRDELRRMVTAELAPMTQAQIASAKGIQHFVLRDKSGKFQRVTSAEAAISAMNDPEAVYEFWARDPSIAAFTDLMNRALDKPAEQLKVTGEDGGPVTHIFKWQK